MAKLTKQQKIEKNLFFIRTQYIRFVEKHYRFFQKDMHLKFYANKELKKEHKYSKSTFPDDKKWGEVEVDVDYDIAVSGNKKKMLQVAFREAVRYAMWKLDKPYMDNNPVFEEEVKSHGLADYGGVAQNGMELHQYGCSGCKKVYMLKEKKLPPAKDVEKLGYLTTCCKKPYKYFGVKRFTNEQLKIMKQKRDERNGLV